MPNPVAVFDTTLGTIKCTIFLDEMPITGSNFIDLVKSGFYNGLQ
jgi:cyclophilin family peptidyl-prolyl cis-trans isomerase